MTPNPHSIDRVSVSESIPYSSHGVLEKIQRAVEKYATNKSEEMVRAREMKQEAVGEFFEQHGYGSYGSSNSVWG